MSSKRHGNDQHGHNSVEENLTTYPVGWRHIVTFAAFLGFLLMYSLRVNMSVALVAMVNHTALLETTNTSKSTSICQNLETHDVAMNSNTSTKSNDGPFVWSSETQGIMLGAFFYGYIMTQFIGGVIAGKFGAKWVFGIGNLMTAVFTLLSPVTAEIGVSAFIAVRIMQGFSSGVTWPSIQALYSRWAPPSERSTLPAIAYAGCFIGTPITFAISGLLVDSGFMGGWPSLFYVFGILMCIWFIFWIFLSSSGPENHKFICIGEKTFITKSLEMVSSGSRKPGLKDMPWKSILSSTAVWAVIISHFTANWGLYVLMTALPSYFKRVQGFDIKKNGVLSALPYLVQFVIHISSGKIADALRVKFSLKTVTVRKLFDCLGHLLPAIFVLSVGFVGCNGMLAVTMLTLTVGFTGLCGAGWFVNLLDIAPQYAGILFGFSNTFGTTAGIIGPYVTGVLTKHNSIWGWRIVFFIIGGFYTISAIFFAIFGQGTVQPWAVPKRHNVVQLEETSEIDNPKI